jgi:hypothetical protein
MSDFSFITTSTINAGLTYLGAWNASTNSPTLTSGVGTAGEYYIVSVAGTTNLDGITNWQVGDWAIFSTANTWQKIDNSQGYKIIQDEGVSLIGQPVLNFIGAGVTATNGSGKTNVTINTSANGTLRRVAMFTPNGTTLGNSPIGTGTTASRVFGTNTGANSINIGYGNTLSGTDNMLIGYDLADGGGQEVYAFGNRFTNSGTAYGIVALGFNNTLNDTTTGLYILGDSNVFSTDTSFSLIVGESNIFDNVSQLSILGNNNSYTNFYSSRVIGSYNSIDNSTNLIVIGDSNFVSGLNSLTIIANSGLGIQIDNTTGNLGVGLAIGASITDTLTLNGTAYFGGTSLTLADNFDLIFGSSTGSKIGTSTNDKFAFWNATPIIQPTTSVSSSAFVVNTGTAINTGSTFDGYTIEKVVKALRNLGLLA